MQKIAHCACGTTSVKVTGEPEIHNVCHCNNCKKRTGSAFGISAYFLKQHVLAICGPTSIYRFCHADQNQERHFCSLCGTTLFWYISSLPNLIGIAGGCFSDDPLGVPNMEVMHANKVSWLKLPDDWTASV